ncbi:MAG: peptidoglycan DD-metalloendopeptidase family protein [Gloeomargarita sp. SKYBB_i_bin120]|nr:peptidoglycan DD-metalloendopeptidase family protein [Gloeomargarita sp. SKYG98]MCS7291826.1 peptidoglycan DD-metalloendopeptidase family protein [Gloeomargarita sp. SKYB120]MDW8177386.1 peptidoglycan DD-metalloendopeptidase family protein [Gloeomargarita sp. SKYBB_i_bin120]
MKVTWLAPGTVGFSLLAVPTHAARLQQWHFNPDTYVLELRTEGAIQPRVQILSQPLRVVIDLPHTLWSLGRDSQSWQRGQVRQVRVAQFDETTTRVVVEFHPGVTFSAQDVQVEALGEGRWRVQLPSGVVAAAPGMPEFGLASRTKALVQGVRVTEAGIFLQTYGRSGGTRVQRSPDNRQVWIDLGNTALSPSYQPQPLPELARLGVQNLRLVQIAQQPPVTRVILQVQPGHTQWQAHVQQVGRLGGILLARGGDLPPLAEAVTAPDKWGIASDPQPVALLRPEMQPQSWALGSFPVENFQAYTSPFGPRGRGFHYGLDLAAPEGSYVRSWWDGRIVDIFNDPACGTGIVIRSGRWEHIYCHLRGRAARDSQGVYLLDPSSGLNIRQGQWVTAGMRIGRVGMTGRTTGPHLHWGLRHDGRWIDPAVVLREMYAQQNRERLAS